MSKVIAFQTSIFGNYGNIVPEPEIMMNILSDLKQEQFIPGTVDVAKLDLATRSLTSEARMSFVKTDKTWKIVFLEERIDFNYEYQKGTDEFYISQLFEYSRLLIEKIFKVFSAITGFRLGINCNIHITKLNIDEEKTPYGENLILPIYKEENDAHLRHWATSSVTEINIPINEKKEICNHRVEISQILGKETDEQEESDNDGIDIEFPMIVNEDLGIGLVKVEFDINTLAEKREERFCPDDLVYFSKETQKYMEQSIQYLEGNL